MLPNTATLDSYGGALRNYSNVIDPTTDEDAKFRNIYAQDTAMMTRTAPRAMRSFVGVNGADPTDPNTGFVHEAMWGSAPGDKPTVVRAGEGIWDITYPETVETELATEDESIGGGESAIIALNFRRASAQVESADGTFKDAKAKVTSPNTVRVYGYTGTTLDDLPGLVITVWIW